jgi:DNA (cytosine-5)-methyltransferase 1
MLTYGSTFTGILGLDRAFEYVLGARCAWACERSAYCREIISREHPEIPIVVDIRGLGGQSDGAGCRLQPEPVDAIIGGFPCPGFSDAGPRTGLDHAESGLWRELARVLGDLRPSIVFLENVRGLVRRGLGDVLADLARLGFDAEWTCLRASDVGAPHRRERWFLLGWRDDGRERLADAYGERLRQLAERDLRGQAERRDTEPAAARASDVADRVHDRRGELRPRDDDDRRHAPGHEPHRRDALELLDHRWPPGPADAEGWARWAGARPSFRRSPDGLPAWVDRARLAEGLRRARLRALGNAVVSQQAARALEILLARALHG